MLYWRALKIAVDNSPEGVWKTEAAAGSDQTVL